MKEETSFLHVRAEQEAIVTCKLEEAFTSNSKGDLDLGLLSLQNCEREMSTAEPLSLWYFIAAAWNYEDGNQTSEKKVRCLEFMDKYIQRKRHPTGFSI